MACALALVLSTGCRWGDDGGGSASAAEAAAARGKDVVAAAGCGSCHTIPGIRGARGRVGPPLSAFGRRSYVAGQLPNTPDNVARWVLDPQAIEPGTAMPDVGLSRREARDVAAYLGTLR